MRIVRCGQWPFPNSSSAARVCVIGLAVVGSGLVSGCASNKQPSYVNGPPMQVAPTPAPVRAAKVEMEEDGKPAQMPGRRIRPEEDDPSQPWSSNYGKGVIPKPIKPAPRTVDAALQPPITPARETRRVQLSEADVDALISRAVAAHEMRRQ
jgi:hypothetical protein